MRRGRLWFVRLIGLIVLLYLGTLYMLDALGIADVGFGPP